MHVKTSKSVLEKRIFLCVYGIHFIFKGLLCLFVLSADTPQPYTDRGPLESDQGQRKACRFRRSWLGSCSGETDPFYGFKEGKPCIIVKLNRIVNFRPRVGLLHTYNIIAFAIIGEFTLIKAQ